MIGSAVFRTRGALVGPWARNLLWRNARAVPTLDLGFAHTKSLRDAISGQNLVSFTRASSGTYIGSDGLVKTATTNEARFDHNPTTGESLGLLVEEARTNLLLRSEEFENSAWNSSPGARTVTANQIAAPDGTTTADLVTADGTSTVHSVLQSLTLSAVPYSYSVFAKAGTNNFLQLRFFVAFGGSFANFNLATGVVGTTSGSVTSSIQAYPNGWYRCTMVFTTTAATSSVGIYIVSSASASSAEVNSLSTSVYLWGAQLEAGAFATSYIPTTTATVTRAADVASITGSNFSSWYNQTEGVFYGQYSVQGLSSQNYLFTASEDTTTNNSHIVYSVNPNLRWQSLTGGVSQQISILTGGHQAKVTYSCATAYQADNYAGSVNGLSVVTDLSGTVPTSITRMAIGSSPSSSFPLNGTIKRLAYWGQRLANTTLQSITAP